MTTIAQANDARPQALRLGHGVQRGEDDPREHDDDDHDEDHERSDTTSAARAMSSVRTPRRARRTALPLGLRRFHRREVTARSPRTPYSRQVDRWQTIIEPFRIHSVEPIRMTTRRRARGRARGRRLQPVQPPRRGRDHRPADRLGHGRHEPRPVGGDAARRRELRRLPVLVPLPRRGPEPVPVQARHPHPPGPRGREDPVLGHRRRRARSSPTTPTSTRRAPTSSTPAPRRSTCTPATRPAARCCRSRATWTSPRWSG